MKDIKCSRYRVSVSGQDDSLLTQFIIQQSCINVTIVPDTELYVTVFLKACDISNITGGKYWMLKQNTESSLKLKKMSVLCSQQ